MSYVTLTWHEFLEEATDFLNISNNLNDNWELFEKNKLDGNTFLKCKKNLQINLPNTKSLAVDHLEETSMSSTDESTVATKTNEVFLLEYHVIYSISYQVPMLYLRIQRNDGSTVELEDVWRILGTSDEFIKTKTRDELLEILTQMEHPVLFKPYYAIHPCKTAELLAQMPKSENRVLSFISLMGPYVKLQLDNRYGTIKGTSKI